MQDYLVISLLDNDEDRMQSLLSMLNGVFRLKGTRMVLIANGADIDRITFEGRNVLPFTAFVSGLDSLTESVDKEESLIFYDTLGEDVISKTLEVMKGTRLNTLMTVGDDTEFLKRVNAKESANVIRTLMVTAEGDRIFIYPESLGYTRENVIDSLIQVDSLTSDGHFSRNKPFAMIMDIDDVHWSEVEVIARHIGMNLELVPAKPLPRHKQYDAILCFSNPGYEPSLVLSFGLPFDYMNAPLQLPMAFKTALEAMEILGA